MRQTIERLWSLSQDVGLCFRFFCVAILEMYVHIAIVRDVKAAFPTVMTSAISWHWGNPHAVILYKNGVKPRLSGE
ncbi:MAG: hypothetical protein ACLPN1_01770 [Dissulfurispiraceae bacterium]|jgi:hypothetical protein